MENGEVPLNAKLELTRVTRGDTWHVTSAGAPVMMAKIDEESTSKWRLYTYHISSWAAALLLASRGDTPSCHTPRSSASLNGRQGNVGVDLNILCDI